MDGGAVIVIIIFGIPMALFVLLFLFFSIGVSFSLLESPNEKIANTGKRKIRYNADDFYDEPDGFYVTMPDGSVRIDD